MNHLPLRLVVAAVALTALPSCVPVAEAQVGYAHLAVDGDLGFVNGASSASIQQDLRSGFGLGDDQGSPYVRGKLDFGVPVVSVSALQFEDEGTGRLAADFGNLSQNVDVASELDLTNVKAALAFEIGLGPVSVSPGLAIDYFDLQLKARDLGGFATEQVDLDAPVPLAFLRGEVEIWDFSAVAEVGYMAVDFDDVEGSLLDVEAQIVWHPTSLLEVFVGYRMFGLEVDGQIDGDTVDTDLTISGFLVGGGVRF